jgi:hypothetical protein
VVSLSLTGVGLAFWVFNMREYILQKIGFAVATFLLTLAIIFFSHL